MKYSNTLRNSVFTLIASVSACAVPAIGFAATDVTPDVRVGASYLNVKRFGESSRDDDIGGRIDARIRLESVEQDSNLVIRARILQTFLEEELEELEREEQRITLAWEKLFQRGAFRFGANYLRKDLFSSEFEDAVSDPEVDPDPGDDGVGLADSGTRSRVTIDLGFDRQLAERYKFVFDFRYQDTQFDVDSLSSRVDFNESFLATGLQVSSSERTSLTFLVGGRYYENDDDLEVDSFRGDLRLQHQLSETAEVYAQVGYESLTGKVPGESSEDENIVPFLVGISSLGDTTRYSLDIQRSARSVSTGNFRERTRVSVRSIFKMSPRLSGEIGLSGVEDKSLQSGIQSSTRRFFSGKLELDWAMGERWFIGFQYFRNQQDFSGSFDPIGAIDSRDEVFLNVRYRGLSRFGNTGGR